MLKFESMKKVLITGSSGFIGQHLKKALEKKQINVVEFSLKNNQDVTKLTDFNKLPKVDTVFHLAAVSGYKTSNQNVNLAYNVNVGGTVNVLEYCKKVKAKLIFPSTYVYDSPYKEYKKESDKQKPTTHYTMTKWLGEKLCRFYARVFKVKSVVARTSNVYGKGQDNIYIVPVIFNHLMKNKKLTLTKSNIERSYLNISDLVSAYIKLGNTNSKPGEIYNVAYPEPTQLKQLVNTIYKTMGKKNLVSYQNESRPHDIDFNRFDTSKIKKKCNWYPKIDLETGLKEYIANL